MTCLQPLGVLVTGAGGQLGRALSAQAVRAAALGLLLRPAAREELDICDPQAVAQRLDAEPIAAVINAAAYTAVDRAESEPGAAEQINARGPGVLADACRARGIRLIQISTDYVFDGAKGAPYVEGDPPVPLGVYGRTKLAGERAALQAPDAIVVRTGWVFSEYGHNFLRTMLRLADERAEIAVVGDQLGGPTYAPAIAEVLLRLLARWRDRSPTPGGIYHFGGAPATNWHDFAQEIFVTASRTGLLASPPLLRRITSAEYPTAAPRPMDARLDCGRLQKLLGRLDNDWRPGVAAALAALQMR